MAIFPMSCIFRFDARYLSFRFNLDHLAHPFVPRDPPYISFYSISTGGFFIIPYLLCNSLHAGLHIPHIRCTTARTLNILQIVWPATKGRVLSGGGQTNVNKRMIAGLGANPQ